MCVRNLISFRATLVNLFTGQVWFCSALFLVVVVVVVVVVFVVIRCTVIKCVF